MIESYAHAPFHYLPPAGGEPPLLTLVNSSGGVLGGDELAMEVELDCGAQLRLRTQAATKLYRSAAGAAHSDCRFRLGAGARLDFFADEIIPFTGSDYEQVTSVDLGPGAMALLAEIVTAGRLARQERFSFTRLALDVRCASGGMLLLRDRVEIRPAAEPLASAAVLGAATVWGSLYLLTARPVDSAFVDEVDERLRDGECAAGGASASPCGLVGRVVGTSVEAVRAALERAHASAVSYMGERSVT